MNTSVERKIASVAEKLKDITYLFDNWATANVRLDKMPLPAMINLLPVSGKFVISRTQLKDCPNCMIAFADKTRFDFDGVENDKVIERCKGYAVQFIKELNKSGLFECYMRAYGQRKRCLSLLQGMAQTGAKFLTRNRRFD